MKEIKHFPNKKIMDVLSRSPLLKDLSLDAIQHFLSVGVLRSYSKHEIIFKQHDLSKDLFIVIKGTIDILLESDSLDITERQMIDPKPIISASEGDSFGELAILTKEERSATAQCVTETSILYTCNRAKFKEFCMKHPSDGLQIIFNLSKNLSAIISKSNKIIIDQYVALHVAKLFKKFLTDINPEKSLINPYRTELEITEPSNFLISAPYSFSEEQITTEYLHITLFAETVVLKNLITNDEPDLGEVISFMLKNIRTHTDMEDQFISAKVSDFKHYRKGSILIKKKTGASPIYLDWTIKGVEFKTDLAGARGNIHIYVYEKDHLPQQAIENYLHYIKMPIQEKFIPLHKDNNVNTSIIVLHHRTFEVVNTLINLRKSGFTIEAFIGIPYGDIDKRQARILDYASDGNFYTLQSSNFANKKSEFLFDFNSSSELSVQFEHLIREYFVKLSDKSYINSMNLLTKIILQTVMEKSLATNKPFVILEDGGYFVPLIYESYYQNHHPLHQLITAVIGKKLLLGVVEGTASGEVRDLKVLAQFNDEQKKLIPLLSGARDAIKTSYESKGISMSIIDSSEVAMRNLGIRTFESRKTLVIGGNGAIGTRLIEQLTLLQNTTDNIVNIDNEENLFTFHVPDEFQSIYQHIHYEQIKRFKISSKDIILSDLPEQDLEPLPDNGRYIIKNSYENNSVDLLEKMVKLGYKTIKSVEEDFFLGLSLTKEGREYFFNFLSKSSILSYDTIKEALLTGLDTILGVTGDSIFSESDLDTFFFRKAREGKTDEIALISGSSKDVEFKKGLLFLNELMVSEDLVPDDKIEFSLNYIKELHAKKIQIFSDEFFDQFFKKNDINTDDISVLRNIYGSLKAKIREIITIRKEIYADVGSTYYLDINGVKKIIYLLADGLVINFFATYSKGASLDYIDPVLTLQFLGINHLVNEKNEGGFRRISDELDPSILKALWSALNDELK